MRWIRWFFGRLFPAPVGPLSVSALQLGDVCIQSVAGEEGTLWQCSIRAKGLFRYSWVATANSIPMALEMAIIEANENPIQKIEGKEFRPKLGGAEFDPE